MSTQRITKAMLLLQLASLNNLTGVKHSLECAYSGYSIYTPEVRNLLSCGYIPARALYDLIHAYMKGFYDGCPKA